MKFTTSGDMVGGNVTLRPRDSREERVEIETENLANKIQLLFAVRYLNYFTKATPLSSHVHLGISDNLPLEVTFHLNDDCSIGHLRFYLAPKMCDDNNDEAEPMAE